jgi:hypothetical protein
MLAPNTPHFLCLLWAQRFSISFYFKKHPHWTGGVAQTLEPLPLQAWSFEFKPPVPQKN